MVKPSALAFSLVYVQCSSLHASMLDSLLPDELVARPRGRRLRRQSDRRAYPPPLSHTHRRPPHGSSSSCTCIDRTGRSTATSWQIFFLVVALEGIRRLSRVYDRRIRAAYYRREAVALQNAAQNTLKGDVPEPAPFRSVVFALSYRSLVGLPCRPFPERHGSE